MHTEKFQSEQYLQKYLTYLKFEKDCSPMTLCCYKAELEKLLIYLNDKIFALNDIKIDLLRDYIYKTCQARKLSPNSIYKLISIYKSFFNYLEENGFIEKNPTRVLKLPRKIKPIPKVVSNDDFKKLISCIKFSPARCRKNCIRDSLIFYMLYYCGLRRSELLNLSWENIDLGKDWLIVRCGKNKKDRIIPLHPKVKELLDLYLIQRLPLKNNALIIGEQGSRLTITSFNNIINMYLAVSGIKKKGYSAHSFRHGFATRLIEKNVNIFMVQRLLGHSSLDSTRIYIHFEKEGYKKAVESL
ncbi:MAG: tyrosine-type recombinase/integrase [Actinomycetota bacterium]|nr:tyrosine-type recombinase/integrase [Actinomycetota bacterium]